MQKPQISQMSITLHPLRLPCHWYKKNYSAFVVVNGELHWRGGQFCAAKCCTFIAFVDIMSRDPQTNL